MNWETASIKLIPGNTDMPLEPSISKTLPLYRALLRSNTTVFYLLQICQQQKELNVEKRLRKITGLYIVYFLKAPLFKRSLFYLFQL